MVPQHQHILAPRGKAAAPTKPKTPTKFYRNAGIILVAVALLYIVSIPIRGHAANSYVEKGDQALSEKNYVEAELQYEKALTLKGGHSLAQDRMKLADAASKDPLALKDFYKARGEADKLQVITSATAFPENDNAALAQAKKLIEEGEYQLAILPAKTASEMSPDYPETWQYMGVANLKAADLAQISPEARDYYLDQANKALAKAKELDPGIQ